jgi:hypothetical protein
MPSKSDLFAAAEIFASMPLEEQLRTAAGIPPNGASDSIHPTTIGYNLLIAGAVLLAIMLIHFLTLMLDTTLAAIVRWLINRKAFQYI